MALFQEDGQSAEHRNEEAKHLLDIIQGGDMDRLSDWETNFIESMADQIDRVTLTPKQIFKLRDIKDKCI